MRGAPVRCPTIRAALNQRSGGSSGSGECGQQAGTAGVVRPQEIAGDIVTMYSKLRVADAAGGAERSVTLVYPADADAAQGMISVLSPLGTALLGLRAGEVARWRGIDGKEGALEVRAIEFQPEASGDYTA